MFLGWVSRFVNGRISTESLPLLYTLWLNNRDFPFLNCYNIDIINLKMKLLQNNEIKGFAIIILEFSRLKLLHSLLIPPICLTKISFSLFWLISLSLLWSTSKIWKEVCIWYQSFLPNLCKSPIFHPKEIGSDVK